MTTTNNDRYVWWRGALTGSVGPIHDGVPQAGFYRRRTREGWEGIAIWFEGEQALAIMGGKSCQADDAWTWAAKNPIPEASYRVWEQTRRFPDDGPVPASDRTVNAGDNLPDTAFDKLRVEIAGEVEQATAFLTAPITTQHEADRAGVWAAKLVKLAKKATDEHDEEKRPFLVGGKAVDDKWRPVVADATAYAGKLKAHVGPFLIKQRQAEEARQEEARKAAEVARSELQKVTDANDASNAERLAELQGQVAQTTKDARPKPVAAGRTGAKVTLRKETVAVVKDYALALAHFANHPETKALIEKLAGQAVRAGVTVPGIEAVTQDKPA